MDLPTIYVIVLTLASNPTVHTQVPNLTFTDQTECQAAAKNYNFAKYGQVLRGTGANCVVAGSQ